MAYQFPLPPKFNSPVLLWGTRKRNYPLDKDQSHFTITGEYLQRKQYYAPQPLDTPDAEFPTSFLVRENVTREEGGCIWFTRTYANMPSSTGSASDDSASYAFRYIGLRDIRPRKTLPVIARLHYDYFKNSTPFHPTTGIPIIPVQRYVSATDANLDVDELTNGGGAIFLTSPSTDEYRIWIAEKREIVAEDSTIEPYLGNIWRRRTIYIVAK